MLFPYLKIHIYTGTSAKKFCDLNKTLFFYDYLVFEICRHFGPPFTLVSSPQDTICDVTSGTCISSACHISSSQTKIYVDQRKCLRDALQRVVET